MFVRWNFTVCSARNSSWAMAALEAPDSRASRIDRSRLLRPASSEALPPVEATRSPAGRSRENENPVPPPVFWISAAQRTAAQP